VGITGGGVSTTATVVEHDAILEIVSVTDTATIFVPNGRSAKNAMWLQHALNARGAPGVTDLVLKPDAHAGYGAPVGCVLTSPRAFIPAQGNFFDDTKLHVTAIGSIAHARASSQS